MIESAKPIPSYMPEFIAWLGEKQGKTRASEIRESPSLLSFWLQQAKLSKKRVYHGSDWHRETMGKVENHFLVRGFRVNREPVLQQGRADLGV